MWSVGPIVAKPARTYVFVLLCCLLGAVGCAADDVVQQQRTIDPPSDVSAPGEAEAPVTLDGLITSEVDTIEVTRSDMGRSRELEARYNALVIEDSSLLPLTPTLFLDGEPFGYTLAISISCTFPQGRTASVVRVGQLAGRLSSAFPRGAT